MAYRRDSDHDRYRLPTPAGARTPRERVFPSPPATRDRSPSYREYWERLLTPPPKPPINCTILEHEQYMDELRRRTQEQAVELEILRRLNDAEDWSTPSPLRRPKGPTQEELDFIENFLEDYSSSESSDEDGEPEAPRVAAPATTPRTSPERAEASTQTPDWQEVGKEQGQPRHRDQPEPPGLREAATQTDQEEGPEQGQPHYQDQLQPAGLQEVQATIELLRVKCEVAEQRVDKREYRHRVEIRRMSDHMQNLREQLTDARLGVVMLQQALRQAVEGERSHQSLRAMLKATGLARERYSNWSSSSSEADEVFVPPPSPATAEGTSSSREARSTLLLSSRTIPTTRAAQGADSKPAVRERVGQTATIPSKKSAVADMPDVTSGRSKG